jgi:hypothetical protein
VSLIDIEAAVVAFLKDHPEVIAVAGQGAVSTELPPNASFPRLRITLTGGRVKARQWLMDYDVTLEAWGTSKVDALELLVAASVALETGLDSAQVTQGTITGCTQDAGVSWAPDPVSNQPRYLTSFSITAHPNP